MSSGNSGSIDPDEQRARFLDLNIERIEQCYVQAVADGMQEPIVLALDTRDETARAVVEALPDLARMPSDDCENPGVVFAMPVDEARVRLGDVHQQTTFFIDHVVKMRELIAKKRTLVIFMMISFELIECKLHPLPE